MHVNDEKLTQAQLHYLRLWQRAAGLAEGTAHDASDIYHCLCNLELSPEERLHAGFVRAGRTYSD